jgi:hypothetical protein
MVQTYAANAGLPRRNFLLTRSYKSCKGRKGRKGRKGHHLLQLAVVLSYHLPRTPRLIGGMSPQHTGAGPRGAAPDTPRSVAP